MCGWDCGVVAVDGDGTGSITCSDGCDVISSGGGDDGMEGLMVIFIFEVTYNYFMDHMISTTTIQLVVQNHHRYM